MMSSSNYYCPLCPCGSYILKRPTARPPSPVAARPPSPVAGPSSPVLTAPSRPVTRNSSKRPTPQEDQLALNEILQFICKEFKRGAVSLTKVALVSALQIAGIPSVPDAALGDYVVRALSKGVRFSFWTLRRGKYSLWANLPSDWAELCCDLEEWRNVQSAKLYLSFNSRFDEFIVIQVWTLITKV